MSPKANVGVAVKNNIFPPAGNRTSGRPQNTNTLKEDHLQGYNPDDGGDMFLLNVG
jgi:hypothetical protein